MGKTMKISVIGAGAWGTTLAHILGNKDIPVSLWAFEEDVADNINALRENKKFLPEIKISRNVEASNDLEKTFAGSDIIVLAIPTKFIRNALIGFDKIIQPSAIILSATKGIEKESLMRPSQIIEEELLIKDTAALSGPNLSREIAQGLPAASVIACKSEEKAKTLQDIISSENFRIYTTKDIIGVEIGGALKNIIAIAAGVCDGLELGNNAKSALMVRAMHEITKLGTILGAKQETFFGLSGIGDLITTCESRLSRNHFVGVELAKGRTLNEILKDIEGIAEGVETTISVKELAEKFNVEMPITNEVYSVLFEGKYPRDAIFSLMTRQLKSEY